MKAIVARCVGLTLLVLALEGCYAFGPTEPSAVAPGMGVRVTISQEEALRQVEALGGLVTEVRGTVTEQTDDQILGLSFRAVGLGPNARFNSFVLVPWGSVEQIESKTFSTFRTVAAAALGVVMTVAILSVADLTSLGGDDEPPVNSFSLFRFSW